MTLDDFFSGFEQSRPLFDALAGAIEKSGPVHMRVSKSQIAFNDGHDFAWAWVPDRYLAPGHAPLVLSLSLPRRDSSVRWKQVVEPAQGRFMHHLELSDPRQIDPAVLDLIAEARRFARGETH